MISNFHNKKIVTVRYSCRYYRYQLRRYDIFMKDYWCVWSDTIPSLIIVCIDVLMLTKSQTELLCVMIVVRLVYLHVEMIAPQLIHKSLSFGWSYSIDERWTKKERDGGCERVKGRMCRRRHCVSLVSAKLIFEGGYSIDMYPVPQSYSDATFFWLHKSAAVAAATCNSRLDIFSRVESCLRGLHSKIPDSIFVDITRTNYLTCHWRVLA